MFSLLLSVWNLVKTIVKLLQVLAAGQARIEARLAQIEADTADILSELKPGPAVALLFTAELDGQIIEGVTMFQMKDSQNVTLTIKPVDKKGNPAPLDGAPKWASSNTELVNVLASEDGLSAVASAVGPLGTATISVTADADLGAGVTELAGSLDITIVAGAAETVEITASEPTEQS